MIVLQEHVDVGNELFGGKAEQYDIEEENTL
jgi:hypothetical protein